MVTYYDPQSCTYPRKLSARIYTIAVESMDIMLLGNFGISFLLSSSVLVAAKYYEKKEGSKEAKKAGYKKMD